MLEVANTNLRAFNTGAELTDQRRDAHDFKQLNNYRQVPDTSYRVVQRPPMLFNRDGHNLFLGDMYRGHSAFLLCGGPSLAAVDPIDLERRGVLTMAVNNAAAVVRPRLWCSVDDPGNFADAIWRDPGITKFVPLAHMDKHLVVRDPNGNLVSSKELVGDMPAVFGFRRNEAFVAERWLDEPSFNWGNHGDQTDAYGQKGGRSVMYVALKLLFHLGIRRVYLVGCDFRMTEGAANYAFEQDRSKGAVRNNNTTYEIFDTRMRHLLPHFQKAGFVVFNCTPNSGLKAFPFVPLIEAYSSVTAAIPPHIRTDGMYDRQAREREASRKLPAATLTHPISRRTGHAVPQISLSVVVPAECQAWKTLPIVIAKWLKAKPWMRSVNILILTLKGTCRCNSTRKELTTLGNVRVINVPRAISNWEAIKVKLVPTLVDTEWFLMLTPALISQRTDGAAWDLLERDGSGSLPHVFVAPFHVEEQQSRGARDRLVFWGRSVPALHVRHRSPSADTATVPQHPRERLGAEVFFGRTDWCRQIATYVGDVLPCDSHIDYARFCAERMRMPFAAARLTDLGWNRPETNTLSLTE